MEDTRNNQVIQAEHDDLNTSVGRSANQIPKVLLASSSPRRSQILRMVGWPFEIGAVEVDESLPVGESARAYVKRLALAKADAASETYAQRPVVAADTTVVVDDQILAKPYDPADAKRMLKMLEGRWHEVLTGIAVVSDSATRVDIETTEVKFASMSDDEIEWYVATGEPMDKAGAYAIQGRGARFIEQIKGDYFNVMGLPVRLLYELMRP